MPRKRHPKKLVEDALRFAENHGWRVEIAVVMPGVEFIVRTMTNSADVGNFASQVYGVRQLTHQIMPGKFEG